MRHYALPFENIWSVLYKFSRGFALPWQDKKSFTDINSNVPRKNMGTDRVKYSGNSCLKHAVSRHTCCDKTNFSTHLTGCQLAYLKCVKHNNNNNNKKKALYI